MSKMKQSILIISLLIAVVVLSACGTNKLTDLSSTASDLLASSSQSAQAAPSTQTIPQSPELLAAYEGALAAIYEKVNPSVVNITVYQKASEAMQNLQDQMPFFDPNQNPFNNPNANPFNNPNNDQNNNNNNNDQNNSQNGSQGDSEIQAGLGSGFVWDEQGHIVTNNHVVENATKLTVTFADGTTLPAEVVGVDPKADLAVIKVDASAADLVPMDVADSNQAKVGQVVVAIGNPFGLEGTMTAGIISALDRSLPVSLEKSLNQSSPSYSIPDIIQTDASINPGNSGGVLVDTQGALLGVTTAIESGSGTNSGVGFVIPSAIVHKVVPSLISDGKVAHPWIGIMGSTLSSDMAALNNLDAAQRGVIVMEVTAGSPAEKAGLQGGSKQADLNGRQVSTGGDVITAVDGQSVQRFEDLVSYLYEQTEVGQKITLTVLRNGKEQAIELTLGSQPTE